MEFCVYTAHEIQSFSHLNETIQIIQSETIYDKFCDPWEDYYENLEKSKFENFQNFQTNQINEIFKQTVSNNCVHPVNDVVEEEVVGGSNDSKNQDNFELESEIRTICTYEETFVNQIEIREPDKKMEDKETFTLEQEHKDEKKEEIICEKPQEPANSTNSDLDKNKEHFHNDSPQRLIAEIDLNEEEETVENEYTDKEAGLAGALSKLRLGEARTPEQAAYEEHMRRQCWESGNIDYTGKDSFDNIWKKITQTLESGQSKGTKAGKASAESST